MLSLLKSMINEKKSFMESTDQLIMENEALDDSIILSEDPEKVAGPEEYKPDENKEGETQPAAAVDPLPTPVGAQTGEPVQLGDDDLLSQEIDLTTNTPVDTLPIPPAGATDAVVSDDILSQPIDSGFGDTAATADNSTLDDILDQPIDNPNPVEDPVPNTDPVSQPPADDDILSQPIGEENGDSIPAPMDPAPAPVEENSSNVDLLSEAITLDDSSSDSENGGEAAPDADQGTDNLVTQAVKDKVNEINSEDETPAEEDPGEDVSTENPAEAAKAVQKKLSNLTKDIENIKTFVTDNLR